MKMSQGLQLSHGFNSRNLWLAFLASCSVLICATPALSQFTTLDPPGGNIEPALILLNQEDQPQIERILHNYSLTISSRIVSNSLGFHTGEPLRLTDWKTTALRLKESKAFSTIALELETSDDGKTYNAIVQTEKRSNTAGSIVLGLLKGVPIKTSYLDVWNLGGSTVHWNSSYRWDSNRQRVRGQLLVPVPLPGLLFLEIGGLWRSEEWDLSPENHYRFKSSGVSLKARRIQSHRVEIGGGVEYSNRAGTTDVGRFLASARFTPLEGKYKSQVHLDGFVARASLLGDVNYSGTTLGLFNRLTVSEDSGTFVDWAVKGGTARGGLPVEDYFILGVDGETPYLLRGHVASDEGRYGRSPMGTDFVLINSDIERRLLTLPISKDMAIKGELFVDAAKVFDRNRVFKQEGWFFDAGVAARIQLADTDLVLLYGRSLTEGTGVITGYIEHRFW